MISIVEIVGGGKEGAGPDGEMADRHAGHVVHAVDLADAEALHHTVVDHRLGAGAAFLGGLEDDDRRTVEAARLGEIAGGSEEHGGMAVMAACMHEARVLRCVVEAGRLGDWQRVHIGAKADDRPVGPAADDADNASAANAGGNLVYLEFAQLVGDESSGAVERHKGVPDGDEYPAARRLYPDGTRQCGW